MLAMSYNRRLLYVWFPFLASEVRIRHQVKQQPQLGLQPFVLTHLHKGTDRLVSLNSAAQAQGLSVGQSLADARSFLSHLTSEPADPQIPEQFLATLARWSERFTPLAGLHGPFKPELGANRQDALVLDISGIAHLFGGEQAMLEHSLRAFADFGLTVQGCITDTKAGARALCLLKPETHIVPRGKIFEAVKDLSIQALEPSAAVTKQLTHLGLLKIEHLVNLPKGGLARRFGLDLVQRLNQMLGLSPDPIEPIEMNRPYSVRLRFPEPLGLQDDLVAAAERILKHLFQRLSKQSLGLRQLVFTLTSPNGECETIQLGFAAACNDLAMVMRLLEPKLEKTTSEFGFDEVRGQALQTGNLLEKQDSLIADSHTQKQDALNQLYSLLGNRIGFEHICHFVPVDTHLPEQRFALAPLIKPELGAPFVARGIAKRPLSCFRPEPLIRTPDTSCHHPPIAFSWRRRPYQIRHAIGPERVVPPWWQQAQGWDKGARDYWQVDTHDGDCLWLFTLPQQHKQASWFVSGRFH